MPAAGPGTNEQGHDPLTRHPSPLFTSVRHAPRRTGSRALRIGLVVLGVVCVVAVASAVTAWIYTSRQLGPTPVAGLSATDGDPLNLLTVHTDGGEPVSVALVQIAEGRDSPVVLSLPLELAVTPPGAPEQPLGEVMQIGGRDLLVAAVADYTGVRVHHYLELSLEGLERLGEAAPDPDCAGCLAEHLADIRRDGRLEPQLVADHLAHLQGVAARHARTSRLISPSRFKASVDGLGAAVVTDVELGPTRALDLVRGFAAADTVRVDVRTVPGYHDPATGRTHPYWEQAETLFQALRRVEPLPDDLGVSAPDLLVPSGVRVLVLNGVGADGAASSVAEELMAAGFAVVGAENAEDFDEGLTTTVVAHRPGGAHEAELVARHLPGARIAELPAERPDADVVVTVGWDRAER